MKLSLAILLLALFTTTLAKPNKGFDKKKIHNIEHEIDEEIKLGEKLAGDIAGKEHEEDGHVAICALELLEDIGHFFEKAFDGKDGDHRGQGEKNEEVGFAKKLAKRKLRSKRRAFVPTFDPTFDFTDYPHPSGGPSAPHTDGPSARPTGGRKECDGALEKFLKCMKGRKGEPDHGHGEHGTGGFEEGTKGWGEFTEGGSEGWEEGTEGGSEEGGSEEGTEGGSDFWEGTEGGSEHGGQEGTPPPPFPYKRKLIPRRHARQH